MTKDSRPADSRHVGEVARRRQPTSVTVWCAQRPIDGAADDDVEQYGGADDKRAAPEERRQQPLGERREHERPDTGPGYRDSCTRTDNTKHRPSIPVDRPPPPSHDQIFGRPFVKRFALRYRTDVPSCLSCLSTLVQYIVAKRLHGSGRHLVRR